MRMTFLFIDSDTIMDYDTPLQEIGWREYMNKRIQIKKYKLHHTMGRPVLMRRHPMTPQHKNTKPHSVLCWTWYWFKRGFWR